jgi:hypothetical protein
MRRQAWPRRAIVPGSDVCPRRVHHHQTQRDDRPSREDCERGGPRRGPTVTSPLHRLSDPIWDHGKCTIVKVASSCSWGPTFVWGWSVHDFFPIQSGPPNLQATRPERDLGIFDFRSRVDQFVNRRPRAPPPVTPRLPPPAPKPPRGDCPRRPGDARVHCPRRPRHAPVTARRTWSLSAVRVTCCSCARCRPRRPGDAQVTAPGAQATPRFTRPGAQVTRRLTPRFTCPGARVTPRLPPAAPK